MHTEQMLALFLSVKLFQMFFCQENFMYISKYKTVVSCI